MIVSGRPDDLEISLFKMLTQPSPAWYTLGMLMIPEIERQQYVGNYFVSTIHHHRFETVIFEPNGYCVAEYVASTRAEALKNHDLAVAKARQLAAEKLDNSTNA